MPLFHIHGIVATLLAPLASGGSVVIPPGFDALRFWGWLNAFRPTWFSAVPTMHQMLLARAERQMAAIRAAPLRFIRSSSAPLPPVVLEQLEATFSGAGDRVLRDDRSEPPDDDQSAAAAAALRRVRRVWLRCGSDDSRRTRR